MNNNLLQVKIKERLNKLASMDYDNIEGWQIVEAFNKAQLEWTRNQISGNNLRKEGDESTKQRMDDLQVLLTDQLLDMTAYENYIETAKLPENYLSFKRLDAQAAKGCCENRSMVVYLSEAADVSLNLKDHLKCPSFEWGETFCVLANNRLRIYTDGEFTLEKPLLIYYRKPREISFEGSVSLETGLPTANVECEFKRDIVEVLVDETAAILAGDLEHTMQFQRSKQSAAQNT